jgi:diadenylate cyclase
VKRTRAAQMLWGLVFVTILYFISTSFGLLTIAWILGNFLSSIIVVTVIVFQDEIRRVLTKVGLQSLLHRSEKNFSSSKSIEEITVACTRLSKLNIGVLIVVQQEVGLDDYMNDAVVLNAQLHRKLLQSIFAKESPLHDGAVIIDGDKVLASGCVLPLSFNPDLDPNLGTRHRAALGISEKSDALVVVVSEESGSISIVKEGKMLRNLDTTSLRDTLIKYLLNEKT